VVIQGETGIPITETMIDALKRRRKAIVIADRPSRLKPFLRRASRVLADVKAEVVMPLRFREELIGLIAVGEKFNGEPFSNEDYDLLAVMANYIAIAIHNQELFGSLESSNRQLRRKATQNRRLYRNLEGLYHDTIKALGAAIDAKDPYTRGHSDRVASFSEAIARRIGLTGRQITAIRVASHLHDIGKIAIDNSILLKPGRLDAREMDQVYRHPTVSYDILNNIKFPYPNVALIARHHHEWVNGQGYPDRIPLNDLNTGMRILSLTDAFDAMTSDRPYRPALDLEVALREVRDNVNIQFDRDVARTFFEILGDEISGQETEPAIIPRIRSRFSPKIVKGLLQRAVADMSDAPGRVARPS
jgi:HD-GYP domain-containing protein (c-di-GMP phosphodiesterase class II)